MRKRLLVLALLLMAAFAAAEEKSYSDVRITILKEETGKPVRNAAVVLHSIDEKGKPSKGGINLKTDSEGKAAFNSVPYGTLRVQVIARGLQTYGEDFEIKQPATDLVIKLKPPQSQYTIYDEQKKSEKN